MNSNHIKALLRQLNDFSSHALEMAAEFSATRTHYEVTIEHMLIKLLEEGGGDIDRVLAHYKVDVDELWQGMLENLSRQRANNPGKPVFSPLLFQWLERAWQSSTQYYESESVRGVGLIDALVELAPTLPGSAFAGLHRISLRGLRKESTEIISGSLEPGWSYAPPQKVTQATVAKSKRKPPPAKSTRVAEEKPAGETALERFTEDVTAKAAEGRIDPVLGRDEEIRIMIDILSRRRKNNPILVGDPGVGKTALLEGLALRIAQTTVPESLQGVRLHTLDLGLLQAGAGVKGEFEKRLKQVIDEVKNSSIPIVMFIDEAHTLIGAGGDAGMSDAANLLKPALARGELRTVAATTWSEYKKYFERDAALERRFQIVKVDEPSEENAIVMLNGLKTHYQNHHNILITDDAVDAAVRLSSRYINGRYLPDKAIDLLDTAAARIRMGQAAKPSSIESAESQIDHLQRRLAHIETEQRHGLVVDEKLVGRLLNDLEVARQQVEAQTVQWQSETELVKTIHDRSSKLHDDSSNPSADDKNVVQLREAAQEARESLKAMQGESPMVQAEVNGTAIAEIIADWTGIPVGRMVKDDVAALMEFEDRIGARVVGQDGAVGVIGKAIRAARAGLQSGESPMGVFLLVGPSGVGKTETARAVAEELLGGERFLITINMSEYQEAHTVSQLKGSPPGYVGYGEGGVLTEAVRQRPYSVVLLDEVEKAHPDVMNMFYQVFDRGFMRDGEGREIDFKNTIIIMTSNLGTDEIIELSTPPESSELEGENNPGTAEVDTWQMPGMAGFRDAIQPALLRHFAPALLGRMQVVPYMPLDGEALTAIVALKLDKVAQRLNSAHDMDFRVQSEVLCHLAGKCQQAETGARFINSLVDQQLLPEVARSLLQFMAEEDMPDALTLELDENNELSCVFSDMQADKDQSSGVSEDSEEKETEAVV